MYYIVVFIIILIIFYLLTNNNENFNLLPYYFPYTNPQTYFRVKNQEKNNPYKPNYNLENINKYIVSSDYVQLQY